MIEAAELHDLATAGQGRKRKAVCQRFSKRRQIGRDAVDVLSARLMPAKAGDHLVENQERAVSMADLLEPGEEVLAWFFEPGRLQNHAGNSLAIFAHQPLDALAIVVSELERSRADAVGDTGGHRRRADKPVARRIKRMVAAKGDIFAARVGPREADRAVHRVRPVLAEFHHLGRRHQLEEEFCTLNLDRRGPAEICAERQLAGDRLEHRLVSVAERDGPQAHSVFDVLVAVQVPNATAFAPRDE